MIKIDCDSLVDSKFLGVPYLELNAGEEDRGFDGTNCMGICVLWLKSKGYDYSLDFRKEKHLRHWWAHQPKRFVNTIMEHGRFIRFSELRKFDVILFFSESDDSERFPTHMGVMIDDRHYLSSKQEIGSFVRMIDLRDKAKFFGGIRLHKVTEKIEA